MLRCGRHFAVWCAAFFFTGTRTYLAPLATSEQAKVQGSSTRAWPQENWFQGEEESKPCPPSTTPASRISLAEEGRDVQSCVVLPMHQSRVHQSGEQGMVRQLRTTFHSGEVVAQEHETKQIPKQEKETGTAKEQEHRRGSHGPESSNTLWKGGRGSDRSRGWSNQCSMDHVNANESIDHQNVDYQWEHSHGSFFRREGQGEGEEWERHWNRTRIAAEACTSQATFGSQGYRRSRSDEQHPGRRGDGQWTAVTETYPQSSDSAAESRTIEGYTSGGNSKLGHSMEGVARVHDKETPRAEGPLPGEARQATHQVRRGQLQDHGLEGGDQDGGGVDDYGKGRRGGVSVCRSSDSTILEPGRSDRTVRRGSRVDGGRTRRRRKEEADIRTNSFTCQEDKEMKVSFENNVAVQVFAEEDIKAKISFLITHEELERWDSKPWALYPGNYATCSLDALLHLGRGRRFNECHGELSQLRRGDLQPYVPVELYNFGRGRRVRGDPATLALLQEYCEQDGDKRQRQVRTFGLLNRPYGQRTWTEENSGATYQWNGLNGQGCVQQILQIVSDLWKDHWHLFPRVYLVGPAHGCDGHCRAFDILVEFMGERTSMCNVPVLVRTISRQDVGNRIFAAYVDHFASWMSVATVCGLDSTRLQRKGNQGGIWFGDRLITNDNEQVLLPGMPVTFEAPADMQRSEGDDAAESKRARIGSNQASSSNRRSLQEAEQDEQDEDLGIEEDGKEGTTEQQEGDPFAHLFHLHTDYSRSRLAAGEGENRGRLAFQRRAQVAAIWNVPTDQIIGLHPLRARPYDLPATEEILITRWRMDDVHRRWQDDVQVLLDLIVDGPADEVPVKRRSVRWIRSVMSKQAILRWLRVDEYCNRVTNDQCRVWLNNDELALAEGRNVRMQMGDYLRIVIPEEEGRSALDHARALRRRERLQQEEIFFLDLNSDQESEDEMSEEETPTTDGRRTEDEPEPHASGMEPYTLELHVALEEGSTFQPPKVTTPTHEGLAFDEVWDLLKWMDAAITQPSWTPPEGVEWHEASQDWLFEEWWTLQHVDEVRFFSDGSSMKEGAGAAIVLFIRSGRQWHYGGYLSQPCMKRCAHYAELQALAMGFHWLNNLLMYCALTQPLMPTVSFAFDATSAGYKAFGIWGGQNYLEEAANLRSTWYMITSRYTFNWDLIHVRAHQGDPGNEMANTLAQAAAKGLFRLRSTSTWGSYIMLTREATLHWVWALWKAEWTGYWHGSALRLPTAPLTTPEVSCLGHTMATQSDDTDQWHDLECNIASANVLTLLPNAKEAVLTGLQGKARTDSLMQMALDANLHIVGLQETRMKAHPKIVQENFFVFSGAASKRGHYGTQLWFLRTKPLDKEGRCYFERKHFKILCQGERILAIRVWAPFFKAVVISAHAPHSQADEADRKRWWDSLKDATPNKYKQWPHFVLIDANARVGEYPNAHVGDHQDDPQDSNGEFFTNYLADRELWLPSTFETIHEGPGGTWHHHGKDQWQRGDYVCLPMQWEFNWCHSSVRSEIDITLIKEDHRVIYAGCRWRTRGHKKPGEGLQWSGEKYDITQLASFFAGSQGHYWRDSLLEVLPQCDWSTDVHTHTAFLQRSLQHWMRQHCRTVRHVPKKKTMSEATWNLVQQKRSIRKWFFDYNHARRRCRLRAVFAIWKGDGGDSWPSETHQDSLIAARHLQQLTELSRQVTKALRQDDLIYFQNVAESMGDANDPATGRSIWQKIRWALPKVKERRQQPPLLLDCLDDQWLGHFADLEAGHCVSAENLMKICNQRQRTRTTVEVKSLHSLPTRVEVERVLRNVQPQKAPGPDQLPNALFKYSANVIAPAIHDTYLKTVAWETEALQHKGGKMIPIFKSGDRSTARNYRGIMLLNTLSKCFHAWTRRKVMEHIGQIRMPTQIGGFAHQQAQFGSQSVQTIARICAAKQLTHACLFVDVRGAYHYLVRELVVGIEKDNDLQAVIENLQRQGIDSKGVQKWSELPSILARVHADPKLISLLKEIHVDTWMTMEQTGQLLRTRRGSRPGSPVADAIYHVLMMDLHIEVHRILESCQEAVDGFAEADIPVSAITWADDLAVPVIVTQAQTMLDTLSYVAVKIYTAFERRGLQLNMSRAKTAAVVSFKGSGAPTMRKTHLLGTNPGVQLQLPDGRTLWLHFTGTYKHLGAVYCADGVMTREVNARLGAARVAFQQLRKIIFGNKRIQVTARLRLLDALIFSKLFYGLSTWSSLGVGLLAKVEAFALRCQRYVCAFPQTGTHDEFKGQYNIPGIQHRLMQHRLIYAASAWIHGPPLLQELLVVEDQVTDGSWLQALRYDVDHCRALLGDAFPSESKDIDGLKLLWRQDPRRWIRAVKKAYKIGVLQECAAADVRGWCTNIVDELHRNGATFYGGPRALPESSHQCQCGKQCKSAQGLAVHRWKAHGEHAPEYQFARGAHCPICMKWLWTSHRLRMHLAYIPRSGKPNSCYQALQQQGEQHRMLEEVIKTPPTAVAGMRLDALKCAGPQAPPRREVDMERDRVEEELRELQAQHQEYPTSDNADLEQVTEISKALCEVLEEWWLRHGGDDPEGNHLWNGVVDLLCTFDAEEKVMDFVFVEWTREILPDVLAKWEDGVAEVIAESTVYNLVKEMPYMQLDSRRTVLLSRLKALGQHRQKEDEAEPHRPIRRGPMSHRGSIRTSKPAIRRYLDEDYWNAQSAQMRWENGVKEANTPLWSQPSGRRCFLILHLFSGRRRNNDYHDAVMKLANGRSFDVRVISLDTAVHPTVGDLSAGGTTWTNVMQLARDGKLAGALAGPPCETFTEARNYYPPDLPESERHLWPRPLRTTERPWGLEELTMKEIRQLRNGTKFALQVAWLVAAMLCYGGHMMVEHPAPPSDPERVSIFRTPIYQLLLQLPEITLRVILQQLWGAGAVKPTGILTLRIPFFFASMNKWKAEVRAAVAPAIGRNSDGSFRTASLKEYPERLSQGFAQCTVDVLQRVSQTGLWRQGSDSAAPLVDWCEKALRATEGIQEGAVMLPDYQEKR